MLIADSIPLGDNLLKINDDDQTFALVGTVDAGTFSSRG